MTDRTQTHTDDDMADADQLGEYGPYGAARVTVTLLAELDPAGFDGQGAMNLDPCHDNTRRAGFAARPARLRRGRRWVPCPTRRSPRR